MNYLAHAYLSFNIPAVLTGNLISDYIKGKKQYDYPAAVQQGIRLHRAIDTFTDEHPATAAAKEVFRKDYRLYSGAFVDVVYDHFLANDNDHFTDNSLLEFSLESYRMLDTFIPIFPAPFDTMYPYMKQYNWLYGYRQKKNIERSFEGLVRRATYLTEFHTAYALFNTHYAVLQQCYDNFFPSLRTHAFETLKTLDK